MSMSSMTFLPDSEGNLFSAPRPPSPYSTQTVVDEHYPWSLSAFSGRVCPFSLVRNLSTTCLLEPAGHISTCPARGWYSVRGHG